jgi:GT2 family glycosyltransferase
LKSLENETYKSVYTVIVDNNSPDGSGRKIADEFNNIPVLINDENLGYAGGMNTGARYALKEGADFVLFVNNDTEFSGSTIAPMVELAQKHKNVGIVSPKVLYLDEKNIIYCAGSRYLFWRCGNVSLGRGRNADENCLHEIEISHAEGACLLVAREVFEKTGFMSEFYFMYFEDLDFSLRVNKDFKIYYTPEAIIYHQSGAGKSFEQYSKLYHYYFTRNRFLIFRNHSFFAKVYVIFYSSAISIIKTFAIIKGASDRIGALKAVWEGFFSGMIYMLGIKKLDENKPLINKNI